MRIVNPTYGVAADAGTAALPAGPAPAGTLCLFSNSKPGATDLLRGVADRLEAECGVADIGFASKPNAASGARGDLLDHLAAQYRTAIVAIGD